jgi:hypothetical protein
MYGLQARFQIDPGDQPRVESNIEKSPQEYSNPDGEYDLPLAEELLIDI